MNPSPKKFFCTFADSRMRRSLKRIKSQASAIGVYDELHILDETRLNADFRQRFSQQLVPSCRGYGYWVWKPQILLQTFEHMKDGDLVHYCDAGCWINPKGKKRLLEYFEMTEQSGSLAFQVKNTFNDPILDTLSLPEYQWTKGDLFDYFNVRDRYDITHSQQIGAGIVFIKKSPQSERFLRRWLATYEDDFSLSDDSPSRSPNFEGFIEHRHDQSIFGILCKLDEVNTISAFEYFYPSSAENRKPDWSKLEHYPIWAKRDKDLGLIGLAKHKLMKVLARLRS